MLHLIVLLRYNSLGDIEFDTFIVNGEDVNTCAVAPVTEAYVYDCDGVYK